MILSFDKGTAMTNAEILQRLQLISTYDVVYDDYDDGWYGGAGAIVKIPDVLGEHADAGELRTLIKELQKQIDKERHDHMAMYPDADDS